jgi:hypothetical protein
MGRMETLNAYALEESGAATVDWVVLTAATVTLGLALMSEISDSLETAGTRLSDTLSDMPIRATFGEWEALRTELGTEVQAGEGGEEGGAGGEEAGGG